ncbi:MAG: alpha/beta hydrolase [Bacteroidales bacterium]|nr:alpha/beta hydrolase [Bacteroidales bacterium]
MDFSRLKRLVHVLAALTIGHIACAQAPAISGSWWGELNMGMNSLAVSFTIETAGGGTATGYMDVPAQGARGIPVELKKVTPDTLEVNVPSLGAAYGGVRVTGNLIKGTFVQRGLKLALDLQPGSIPARRPQTPKAPYPYVTEDVTFRNDKAGAVLSGTLTYPLMHYRYPAGTIPVVLMVTGSGLQDRDETIMDHKPFLVIADHLARNGIASLRYDDRGAGSSEGPVEGTTSADNMEDAEAGIAYLRSLGKFGKVGVLGHSEGGTIAFMLAGEHAVDFIVSLAGTTIPGSEVLVGQNRALFLQGGVPAATVDQYVEALKVVYADRTAGVKVEDTREYVDRLCREHGLSLPENLRANLELLPTAGGEWMTWFLGYDPSQAIRNIICPVFALNGTHDLQVLSRDNLPVLRENLQPDQRHRIEEYDSLNHLFQHCTPADAMNYWGIEETISKEVLEDIAEWVKSVK